MKSRMMNFSVLVSALLLLNLAGCATRLPPITELEIIRVPQPTPIEIPKSKLPQCDRVELPALDSQWLSLPGSFLSVLQKLDKCNAQIAAFWMWYAAQEVESIE